MGTVIYIWNSTKRQFGHASMKLSDGTYISWWPRKEAHSLYTEIKISRPDKPDPVYKNVVINPTKNMKMDTLPAICFFKVKAILGESYFDDVTTMGIKADQVLILRKGLLDEERINNFWRKVRVEQPYILGTNNCADMIFRAMRIGGATAYVPDPGFTYVWNTRRLYNYVERFSFFAMVLNSNSRIGEYFEMKDLPRHRRKPLRQAFM